MANDPFLPLFRALRTEIIRKHVNPDFDEAMPINNYYFSDAKINEMECIQTSNLDIERVQISLEKLRSQISARMSLAAPELMSRINTLEGYSFLKLFQRGLRPPPHH